MDYDINVTLPNYGDRTNESEYNDLIREFESLGGFLTRSDMGLTGYRFYVTMPTGTNSKQLKREIQDMLDDYGLELEFVYDASGFVY